MEQKKSKEKRSASTHGFCRLPLLRRGSSGSVARGRRWFHWWSSERRGSGVWGRMAARKGSRGSAKFLYAGVSLVYGAPGMETIGPHGRFSETTLCTGSSGEVEGESGRVVRSVRPGFHSGCAGFGAWHSVLGWLGCRACCASCRVHGAMHARVLSDARVCVCAREHACQS
jgi:hypothetical protein